MSRWLPLIATAVLGMGCEAVDAPTGTDASWLFRERTVRALDLWIAPEDVARLTEDPRSWVPADLQLGDQTVEDIAVRLKGNGSFQTLRGEPSFKLNLDRTVDGQELDGLDELTLDNDITDPTGVRRRLAHERYRAAGVPAPRTTHVFVRINGVPSGVSSLSEAVDGRFLDRWFGDGSGSLFEVFDADLWTQDLKDLDHDSGPASTDDLHALATTLADPLARFTVEGQAHLDVDAWIRFFAASALLAHFDAYPYTRDDVFLYQDPATGLWAPIPHGTDETFGDPARSVTAMTGLLGRWCMEDPACVLRFTDALWTQLDAQERDHTDARACALQQGLRELDPELARCSAVLAARIATRRDQLEGLASLAPPP